MNSSSHRRLALPLVGLLAALAFAALGAVTGGALLRDEPGLVFEFFPLEIGWEGDPLFAAVGMPHVDAVEDLAGVASKAIFSARWRGWLWIEEAGRHELAIWADDRGYLAIDGERLLETGRPPAGRRKRGEIELSRGFHAIEVGLAQLDGAVGLGVEWVQPGGEPMVLPAAALYPRRPLGLYRWLRRATSAVSPLGARLLGAVLLLLAFLSLRAVWRPASRASGPLELRHRNGRGVSELLPGWLRRALGTRRRRYAVFFLALFAVTWVVAMPWAVSTLAGDDANYHIATQAPRQSGWFLHRMAHVYLLKGFLELLAGGDAFFGSRLYGAFVFAVTVTALAVAVRQLGPGLQTRTLAVTLFLLFSQTTLIGLLGAAFADFTVMMFVTVALAVFLHGRSVEASRPRHEWHALALGVLTLAATKSKVTGIIVLVLPALLLWAEGRVDWRRWLRRMAYWSGGLAAALLVLMTADAIWLGDFWWALRPEKFKEAGEVFLRHSPAGVSRPDRGWLEVIWPPGANGAARDLGVLWCLALVAPLVAAVRRVSIERRLLYLLPAAYLLMLIILYSRLELPIFSSRMLIPILPVACFVGGALFLELGVERPSWGELLSPRFLVPLYLAGTAICLIVTPYLAGELGAEELVPLEFAGRFGWEPDHFLRATQFPAMLLVGLFVASLFFGSWRVRLALALFVTIGLSSVSFHTSARALEHRTTAQRGEQILYPWRAFEEEIVAVRPKRIQVSPDILWRLNMLGGTYEWTAGLFFDRTDLEVSVDRAVPRDAELAIASRYAYNEWRRAAPDLAATATFDPSGQLALLRPRKAIHGFQTR